MKWNLIFRSGTRIRSKLETSEILTCVACCGRDCGRSAGLTENGTESDYVYQSRIALCSLGRSKSSICGPAEIDLFVSDSPVRLSVIVARVRDGAFARCLSIA
jgi:hypothetical protein